MMKHILGFSLFAAVVMTAALQFMPTTAGLALATVMIAGAGYGWFRYAQARRPWWRRALDRLPSRRRLPWSRRRRWI